MNWRKNKMEDITAIILTKNEELNISRCINSIIGLVKRIVIVDSYSTDNTVDIARQMSAEIYTHSWKHYSDQFNWALDNINIQTKWVYRIDADEVVTPNLKEEIIEKCRLHRSDNINGFVMKFKIFFMGKFLRHGGVYPFYNLTIFKYGKGRYEERAMGEHIILNDGKTIDLINDCIHYDFKDLSSWVDKHNKYSTREVFDYYDGKKKSSNLYHEAKKTINLRDNFYYRLPLFLRARLFFLYKYYFKLGFLDGKPGRIYAFLQSYWYRFLVDAKIYEQINNNEKR